MAQVQRCGKCADSKSPRRARAKMFDVSVHGDQPLGFLLYQLMSALRPHVNAELRPFGIGLAEFVCMRNVAMWPDRSNAELARRANVTPQAMSLVLKDLEALGLITRPGETSGGRSLPARLTRKGTALLRRAEAAVLIADAHVMEDLAPAEREELKRLLTIVSAP